MNLFESLIYGVVEGLTEFLPISSTGHLIITERLLGGSSSDFLKSFIIAIQPGAIMAVLVLYWRSLLVDWEVIKRVAVAFLPTAILGVVLYPQIKKLLDKDSLDVVLWSLGLGGIGLVAFELFHGERKGACEGTTNIRYRQAFWIGVCQTAAFIPGVSRAAATVIGGLALGVNRKTVVEFSFLLAVPTMAAASGYDLFKSAGHFTTDQLQFLLVGVVTSFVVAILAIRFLLYFVTTHSFVAFGIYRIVAALGFGYLLLHA